ncbi:MAG: zinc-binding dehydrogenase [Myxococcota bacterium]
MKAWRVVRYGRPSEALSLDEIEAPEPGPGQLRIATRATALNYNEVDGCYGRYLTVNPPLPYTLGMEAVGVVDAVGAPAHAGAPSLEPWLGRRVALTGAGATGAHAERVVGDAAMAFASPDSLGDDEAAAFFFPYHVAGLALLERAALREGETLLVHAAAGGVGSAALLLGRALGARVIATAGGAEKVAFCRSLGADVAIDYRAEPFDEAVLAATNGRGVDVVCDLVGGEVTQRSLRCTARGGRVVLAGFSGGIEEEDRAGLLPRPIVFGNVSLVGVMLAYVPEETPPVAGLGLFPRSVGERLQERLVALLDAGAIRPVVGRTASFESLPAELERTEARQSVGRTILRW